MSVRLSDSRVALSGEWSVTICRGDGARWPSVMVVKQDGSAPVLRTVEGKEYGTLRFVIGMPGTWMIHDMDGTVSDHGHVTVEERPTTAADYYSMQQWSDVEPECDCISCLGYPDNGRG